MLAIDQQEKAAELSLALQWGYSDISDAVEWANSVILNARVVNDDVFIISLAQKPSTALPYLNNISNYADEWNALRLFLKQFCDTMTLPFQDASKLAEYLYIKWTYNDAPDDTLCFSLRWDDIDLVVDGIVGNPTDAIAEFLSDIRKVTNHHKVS